MKEIVKVLLQEGIDEETIHEVLDVINEVSAYKLRGIAYDVADDRRLKAEADDKEKTQAEKDYLDSLKNYNGNKFQIFNNNPLYDKVKSTTAKAAKSKDRFYHAAALSNLHAKNRKQGANTFFKSSHSGFRKALKNQDGKRVTHYARIVSQDPIKSRHKWKSFADAMDAKDG